MNISKDELYELHDKILDKIDTTEQYKTMLQDMFCYIFESEIYSNCNYESLLERLKSYLDCFNK